MEAVSGRCLDTLSGLVAKRAVLVLVLAVLSAKLVAQVPVPDRDFISRRGMKRVKQLTGRAGAFNFDRGLQGSTYLGKYWQHSSTNSIFLSFVYILFFFFFPFISLNCLSFYEIQ